MKKLISLLLCLLMGIFGPWALAAEEFQGNLLYELAGGTIYFSPEENRITGAMDLSGDVSIPAAFDGVSVKIIGGLGGMNPELTGITLPEGLEKVEVSAFSSCPALQTIRLSSTVREFPGAAIDGETPAAFQVSPDNPWLTAGEDGVLYTKDKTRLVRCPAGVTFYTVPEGVEELDGHAFFACRSLTALTLPESLGKIGDSALESCSALEKLYIPGNVTEIGRGLAWLSASFQVAPENPAFSSDDQGALYDKAKTALLRFPPKDEEAHIPEGVTALGDDAFSGGKLESLSLPGSLEAIGSFAFNSCPNLTQIILPEGLRSIGERAFTNCAVRSLVLPDSLEFLGAYAFSGAYDLRAVIFPQDIEAVEGSLLEDFLCYVERGTPMEQKLIDLQACYRYGKPEDYPEDTPLPMAGTTYVDVSPDGMWEQDIQTAHAMGWIRGETPLYFRPEKAADRAVLVTVLYRMAGSPEIEARESFQDVRPGSYYEKAAAWAREKGILAGDRGNMRPQSPVTRQEAAALFYRYLLSQSVEFSPSIPADFADRGSIASWAVEAVDALTAKGIFLDGEAGPWGEKRSFSPKSGIIRRELVSLLRDVYRAAENSGPVS